jgi:hypothetical protein
MAPRTSWLLRLPEIRRSVSESVRSHYDSRDLQRLFRVKPRAAQKLIKMCATGAKIGRSALVERVALADFLTLVADSDDPELTLRSRRRKKTPTPAPRRALRCLVQVDSDPATLETIPRNIILSTGKMEIEFTRMEELAGALHAIAQILENEFEEFADRFEPAIEHTPEPELDSVAEDLRRAWAELTLREREKASGCETTSPEPNLNGNDLRAV